MKLRIFLALSYVFLSTLAGVTPLSAKESLEVLDETSTPEHLVLKLMVVNPSDKFKQTFPLKAYLPEEVKPEYIKGKEDLEIAYDAAQKSYYLVKEIELDPGQSVVKTIEIEDIWYIPEDRMKDISDEVHDLAKKLQGTKYERHAELLVNNVETLLLQIFESQNDKTLTPEQHISVYRDNKEKLRDIEMDLMAMRRLAVNAGIELGAAYNAQGSSAGLPGILGQLGAQDESMGAGKGQVPAWVLWRVIFMIIMFTGLVSIFFFALWQHQLRNLQKRQKLMPKKSESVFDNLDQYKISDFLPGKEEFPPKDDDQQPA